jgi:hypothetical protein
MCLLPCRTGHESELERVDGNGTIVKGLDQQEIRGLVDYISRGSNGLPCVMGSLSAVGATLV